MRNRVLNIFSLLKLRGRITHITGDVHYAILGAWLSKRVLTIHDLEFMNRTSGITREIYKLFWIKLPVRFAHRVTTISETTKNDIVSFTKIKPEKIKVIYDFADPIYQPATRVFNSVNPSILCIGTKHNKNLPRLIEAIVSVNCELIIVGKLNNTLKQMLTSYSVSYRNFQNLSLEDLHKLYLQADLLAYVSLQEGFGMPIIEAQNTGLPVVTSSVSCMPEIAGEGAVFVDPLSIDSIREGICKTIGDAQLRNEVISKGYENAKRFSYEGTAKKYAGLYRELSCIS